MAVREPAPETPSSKSPQRKVVASAVGAGIGVQTADFANWCIGNVWFTPDTVPTPVSAFVAAVVTTGFALAGGYFVKRAPGE